MNVLENDLEEVLGLYKGYKTLALFGEKFNAVVNKFHVQLMDCVQDDSEIKLGMALVYKLMV